MKWPAALGAAVSMSLALFLQSAADRPGTVEVARLGEANWEEFVPEGKEVDAIYGDIVLRNRHFTAVIAQPLASRHANMSVRDIAGALIDLTSSDFESDQLSAYYPGRRAYLYRELAATVDDKDALASAGPKDAVSGRTGRIVVRAAAAEGKPAVETIYELEADQPFLAITTRYTNESQAPLTVGLTDDLRADGGKEQMKKSPNGTAPLFWIHDEFWEQAYGLDAPGRQVQANNDARLSVLKFANGAGDTAVTLEPGETFELTRRIWPGRDLLAVKATADRLADRKVAAVKMIVRDQEGRPIPDALVEVSQQGEVRGTAMTDRDGIVRTSLPPGTYAVQVTALGTLVFGGDGAAEVTVHDRAETQELTLESGSYHPGTVTAAITDASGRPIPCKVEFTPKDREREPPYFGPDTAEFGVRNVRYTPDGTFTQDLPAGRYDVIISRGPEYDAIFTEIAVPPGGKVALARKLVRTVETPGWVSSDFHSHSSPSGDNTGSQLGRVLNLACEHLEFIPCTEHNRVSTYVPHIEALGLQPFVTTVSGIELTGRPLPLNHQNAFPMKHIPRTQDGGGPVNDVDPEKQIERLALWDNRSEKLLQQNHPDVGWLFYDRNGDGQPDDGYERSFPLMDVMEIHPLQNALALEPFETWEGRAGNNRVFNWLQLLNQGFHIYGVVNTDAHYNYHGSGWLRNWIQSSTDDPAQIDPMEMVHAAEQGRLIMSNGPFLEVSMRVVDSLRESNVRSRSERTTITAGEALAAPAGKLVLKIRVQCPNWHDINRVFVLVNGRIHAEHDYMRAKHPDRFRSGVVKFEQELPLELQEDAHVIVVAGGEKLELGPVVGPAMANVPPVALSNPMFVDVDGNGFRPNQDTLGHPLPVKYVPKRK